MVPNMQGECINMYINLLILNRVRNIRYYVDICQCEVTGSIDPSGYNLKM